MRLRYRLISAKSAEPPLPYPPPPPFVPLTVADVDDQIGLLKPFYHSRIALLVASSAPPPVAVQPTPLSGPVMDGGIKPSAPSPMLPPGNQSTNQNPPPANPQAPAPPPPDLVLPDDTSNPSRLKMGPIGQIMKSGGTSGGTKKKGKVVVEGGTNVVAGGGGGGGGGPVVAVGMSGTRMSDSGGLKKVATGVGTGNGRKKNARIK